MHFSSLPGGGRRFKRVSVMNLSSSKLFSLAFALLLWAPSSANAQSTDPDEMDDEAAFGDEAADDEPEDDPSLGPAKASAHDDRTLHLYAGAHVSAVFPAGSLAREVSLPSLASAGLGVGGFLGLGLTRSLVLSAKGTYAMLGAQENCANCKASAFDLGLGFTYHIAQGIALDPWVGYGVGVRWINTPNAVFNTPAFAGALNEESTQGLDLARLSMGGDFYPLPMLGIGLFAEADIGRTVRHPFPELLPSTYVFFQLGARVVLDPSSKSIRKASPSSEK